MLNVTHIRRMQEYIFSTDTYAATGVMALLSESGTTPVRLIDESDLLDSVSVQINGLWRLTIVIPDDPLMLLRLTESLARLVRHCSRPPCVLVISPVPADWLMQTLKALGCSPGLLGNFTVVPLSITPSLLQFVLTGKVSPSLSAPQTVKRKDALQVLTPSEHKAVTELLSGNPVHASASTMGRSVKTLYSHRSTGLCKLSSVFPALKPRGKKHQSHAVSKRQKVTIKPEIKS
ncbi:hypothetical protein ACWXWB_22485 [Pantoea dispersa]